MRETQVRTFAALVVVTAIAFAWCGAAFGGAAPTVVAQVALSLAGLAGAAIAWRRDDRATLVAIVVAGLIARAALLPFAPAHSNDVYRYLWDGRDLARGIDPYVVLPSAPALAALRAGDWLYPHIDWANVPTLYPPFDLALFALGFAIDPAHVTGLKAVLLLGDLGTMAVLIVGLRRAKLPAGRLAVYAWNPLVITEFAGGGHEEAWAVFWIVAALVALRAERPVTSALSLAAAVLTKLYPLAFVPVFFAARRTWYLAIVSVSAVLVAYLPFVLWVAGEKSTGQNADTLGFLHTFAYGYRFNDSLHEVLGTDGAALLFAAVVAAAVLARVRDARLAALVFVVELAYLACSANVYPWYATIFPALAPLVPYAFRGAWRPLTLGTLGWSALTPLAYLDRQVLAQGGVADDAAHVLEYVPLYAGLALALAYLVRYERAASVRAVRESLRSLVPRRPRRAVPSAPAAPARMYPPRVDLRLDELRDRSRALDEPRP